MRSSLFLLVALAVSLRAQQPPYENPIPADPPYYRVRYEGSTKPEELVFPVSFTVWIPSGVKTLRGVVVHQHGCGEGSCKSGQTGAFDLHWQALAKKHDCALLVPVYEQPEKADCGLWCDPRNGSDAAFQKALRDLGAMCGHAELATVPWALWGHSGGGTWCGAMTLLHPDRVAAAWLRSGVPPLKGIAGKRAPLEIPDAALGVPMMCNLGTKEGVTVKDPRFGGVWNGVESFFAAMREKGGLIAVSVDPLTSHECGNQRYLAIRWLDACLAERLPGRASAPLRAMPTRGAWLAEFNATNPRASVAVVRNEFAGDVKRSVWLPNEAIAKAWMKYLEDTDLPDTTPPPAPTHVRVNGNEVTWEAEADVESGLAGFVIERDGDEIGRIDGKNSFGQPLFQNLSYSDTPTQPLARMQFRDTGVLAGTKHKYRVISVNTVGLRAKSKEVGE